MDTVGKFTNSNIFLVENMYSIVILSFIIFQQHIIR
jgi:hypothetical protein